MLSFLSSLLGIALGQFVEVVDNTMLNIALPTISNDLKISLSTTQWIPITFVLVTSSFLMPSAKIADLYGRKKIYIVGLIIFCGAVFITGKAEIVMILILFKSIQGIGSAAIQSNGMAMIIQLFNVKDRGKALRKALDELINGDILVILGKGREDYQEINGKKINYSDIEIVKGFINAN